MRPVIALALLASSLSPLAAAADASCPDGADVIVNTCLDQQNAILATCTDGDWDCKCHAWQSIVQYVLPPFLSFLAPTSFPPQIHRH